MYLLHQYIRQAATDGHPGTWAAYRQSTVHMEVGRDLQASTHRQAGKGRGSGKRPHL